MNFFDYFQVAAVLLFAFAVLTRTLYMKLTKGINPIAVGKGKRGWQLAFEISAFAGLALWITETILHALHSKFEILQSPPDIQLFSDTLLSSLGVFVVSVGFVILIWAFISFGNSWRVGFDTKNPGHLVTSGIFRYSRNPIYLAVGLWFLGVFLMNGRLAFFIFVVFAFVYIHLQVFREEDFLKELYGQAYTNYQNRTDRYL